MDLLEFLIRRYENAITEIDASILGFHKIPEYLSSKIKGLNLNNSKFRDDHSCIDEICNVPEINKFTKSYIHHLLKSNEILGMVILSTSQGVIADHDARAKNLGGEILFKIF